MLTPDNSKLGKAYDIVLCIAGVLAVVVVLWLIWNAAIRLSDNQSEAAPRPTHPGATKAWNPPNDMHAFVGPTEWYGPLNPGDTIWMILADRMAEEGVKADQSEEATQKAVAMVEEMNPGFDPGDIQAGTIVEIRRPWCTTVAAASDYQVGCSR